MGCRRISCIARRLAIGALKDALARWPGTTETRDGPEMLNGSGTGMDGSGVQEP